MSKKKSCPGGEKWDTLLSACIHEGAAPGPSDDPLLPSDPELMAASPVGRSQSTSQVSPMLWTLVVLTTAGSVLALVLWMVIFIRRRRRTTGFRAPDHPTKTEFLNKPAALPTGVSSSESQGSAHSCHHDLPHPSAPSGPSLGPVWSHRVPLPATELGGTALVTTKTVAGGAGS
ncbi:tumor necrosis factor receptor superfamily member 13C-like [Synchiropus splendidus]|uniref:tumor necrosis factor receptor superfamily member 13C-like n=1 Tax=Synchiropus splendidus TaxID=270530 RepID=UPI00237E5BE9|nr:tumor necrosis factor receptor superfamily member 13C-like [Synchiropus splendidus]